MTCRTLLAALVVATLAAPAPADATTRRSGDRHRADRARVAHPEALRAVDDCADLREHMTGIAVDRLVESLYFWWFFPWSSPEGGGGSGGPADWSETNVQEAGVDELDLVETDGHHLYITDEGSLRILRSWPPETTAAIGEVELGSSSQGLFLLDDRALTVSHGWEENTEVPWHSWWSSRLDLVDVSDRTHPTVERTLAIEGWVRDARRIGPDVYVVVQAWLDTPPTVWEILERPDLELPEIEPDASWEERLAAAQIARGILQPLVAEVVGELTEDELLPAVTDRVAGQGEATRTALISCSDLMLDDASPWLHFTSIVHLDMAATDPPGGDIDATGLLSWGGTVYASGRTLYLAEPGWARSSTWEEPTQTTVIHAFDLTPDDEDTVVYAAVGEVDGYVYDQFALSEHAGHLRVASHVGWWWQDDGEPPHSLVTVLARRDARLDEVGRLGDIAPGEQLYAVRFVGETGYLVTFEQIDPLFTVDLSDPREPTLLGELEVTGFSTYLHPIADDHLLAVGLEVDPDTNRTEGLAVSLFDVRDLEAPTLADRLVLDREDGQWSEALSDHHAFTYHRGVLAFPTYRWDGTTSDALLQVVEATPDRGLAPLGEVSHVGLGPEGQWCRMRRSVIIEEWLYSISSAGVRVTPLRNPATVVAEVPFD